MECWELEDSVETDEMVEVDELVDETMVEAGVEDVVGGREWEMVGVVLDPVMPWTVLSWAVAEHSSSVDPLGQQPPSVQ